MIGNFNTPLASKDRSSRPRKKNQQGKATLNDTLDQINITDIYRTFHSTAAEYTFFSRAHRISYRIDHMLGNKTSVNKLK